MQFRKHPAPEASISTAPLLDVVLLLLIFFVVSSTFAERRLALALPSSEAASEAQPSPLVIEVDASGGVFVAGEPVDDAALRAKLERAAADARAVDLRADEKAPHGAVVRVLGVARASGVDELGIAVDESAPPAN